MKKILGFIFILTLFIMGCTDEGFLRIVNNTSADVWYQVNNTSTEWLSHGESASFSWDLNTSLFGDEYKKIIVTYGGEELFINDSYEVVKIIKPGKTSYVEIIGDRGVLKIINNSCEDVWFQVNDNAIGWLSPGDWTTYTWNLNTILFKEVSVKYGGDYWFLYEFYEVNTTIQPGQIFNLDIIGDTGEIKITNDAQETSILSIFLSPSSSSNWGENLLGSDILYPGHYVSWLVTIGLWDIRLIDENDYEYVFWEQQVEPETLYEYLFTDAKGSSDLIGEKITNSQKYSEKIEGNCIRKNK